MMERKLLIDICTPDGCGSSDKLIKGIDWELFYNIAEEEGLAGYVYKCLKDSEIPEGCLFDLRESFAFNMKSGLSQFNSLRRVLHCLKTSGIEPLVFRGASLAGDVYPSFGMREFKDVDLLIRKNDFKKAIDVLKKNGFKNSEPYISVLFNDDIFIDLHTDFMTYSREKAVGLCVKTDIDSVFERAQKKKVQGVEFLTPHPEDGLLSLALHLQMHSFDRLIAFLDIARLASFYRDKIDGKRFFERAGFMGLEKTVYYSFSLMPQKWKSYNEDVLKASNDKYLSCSERFLLKRLKINRSIPYSGDTFFLFATKGLWKKLFFLKAVLLPEEELKSNGAVIGFLKFLAGRFLGIGRLILSIAKGRRGLVYM